MSGCSAIWSDPFAAPPVGQKFVVMPDPPSQFPLSIHAETLVTRATIVKLGRVSDLSSSRSGVGTIASGNDSVEFKSISLVGKHGFKDVYTLERIRKLNETDECKGIRSDLKDLLSMYSGTTLVCGSEFTNAFREALTVTVTTEDGKEVEFTSWGSNWSEVGGYRVVIQSMAL
jgi:hypothetical protein